MTTRNEKNRVLTQTELIAKDLRTILIRHAGGGQFSVNPDAMKELAAYVLEQRHEDFFNGQRVGVVAGRREAVGVIETLIQGKVPVLLVASEKDKKVYSEKPSYAVPVERLSQAVAALRVGLGGKQ